MEFCLNNHATANFNVKNVIQNDLINLSKPQKNQKFFLRYIQKSMNLCGLSLVLNVEYPYKKMEVVHTCTYNFYYINILFIKIKF